MNNSSGNAPGNAPGNANLPIGDGPPTNNANVENANAEIGGPGKNANVEIGGPRLEIGGPGSYWHSRGYLPHFESPDMIQHVTWHLADSMPKAALDRMTDELKHLPPDKQRVERRIRIEAWLDAGYGDCILREPSIAQMTQECLLHFDGARYRMLAWVVMPNHVHTLFQPSNGWTVAKIVASWKKFTARQICDHRRAGNANLGNANLPIGVWHREYWDRFIRDERHFYAALNYIHQNPVKAGLCAREEDWVWGSAFAGGGKNANREIGGPGGGDTTSPSAPHF